MDNEEILMRAKMAEAQDRMQKRLKMVKAMEYIARQVNDEDVFYNWLATGVADGDIEYGDLKVKIPFEDDEAFWYAEDDDEFAELMSEFLKLMRGAMRSGGLYCGGVVSK